MITLTEAAAAKVKFNLAQRPTGLGLLIGVRTTGCSGLAYKLEYVDQLHTVQDYDNYNCHGVDIWVNPKDMPYLAGMKMDWVRKVLTKVLILLIPKKQPAAVVEKVLQYDNSTI
jgi:iron-sulfur cluster assembly protein